MCRRYAITLNTKVVVALLKRQEQAGSYAVPDI